MLNEGRRQEAGGRRQKEQLQGDSNPPRATQAFEETSNDAPSAIEDRHNL